MQTVVDQAQTSSQTSLVGVVSGGAVTISSVTLRGDFDVPKSLADLTMMSYLARRLQLGRGAVILNPNEDSHDRTPLAAFHLQHISGTRAETRSERSESSRSEPGSESDQAHSTWSSVSAPAALVDRMPPDSSRLCLGAVSVLPTTVRSGRTSPPLGHGGADATSRCLRAHSPTSINPRPPLQNTNVRPPARNARCQTTMRPPAPPTAAAGSVDGGGDGDDGGRGRGGSLAGSTARLTGLRLHPSLRVSSSAIPPEWNLQSTRDSEERGSVCSSSSSCSSISINSNDEDSFSRRWAWLDMAFPTLHRILSVQYGNESRGGMKA